MTASTVRHWTRETALTVGAIVGCVCVLAAAAALIFGVKPLVFESGSMGPHIDTGALGVAVSTPASKLHVGDVVSVRNDAGDRITHRIVGKTAAGEGRAALTLRGDANASPDAQTYQVTKADRLLFSVNGLGYVVAALQSPAAIFAGGLLVGILLMVAFRRRDRSDVAHDDDVAHDVVDDGDPPGGGAKHRSARKLGAGAVVVAALLGVLVPFGASEVRGTKASYTDSAAAASVLAAKTIGTASGTCRYDSGLLGGSFVITWKFPPGESYSMANVEFERSKTTGLGGILEPIDGGAITTDGPDDSGTYTTIVATSLLGGLLGGDFNFGITVKDSGWRSKTVTANAHVALLGLGGSCKTPFG